MTNAEIITNLAANRRALSNAIVDDVDSATMEQCIVNLNRAINMVVLGGVNLSVAASAGLVAYATNVLHERRVAIVTL